MSTNQAAAFCFNRENPNFPINFTSRLTYRVLRIAK